jgi:hypothetical protein
VTKLWTDEIASASRVRVAVAPIKPPFAVPSSFPRPG